MQAESVHSVWEYYDGILSGVADHRGHPHYFEKEWNASKRDYLPTFTLTPITTDELTEVIEQERIFRAWEAKYHRGDVEANTHPGAAGQPASYFELEIRFKARSADSSGPILRSLPTFLAVPGQPTRPKGVLAKLLVKWHDAA
jgi:hypothetical protein